MHVIYIDALTRIHVYTLIYFNARIRTHVYTNTYAYVYRLMCVILKNSRGRSLWSCSDPREGK